ncbi:MAG TPA: YdeI/OmpD-associated family protein [Patescibacteria group bacterium]|nr:YdeI/OmpD-associated family protein [Patescibacteria group bacterium]
MIEFRAPIELVHDTMLVVLPAPASQLLPSRGMVMVQGTIDGATFTAPVEPDGRGSHWFKVADVVDTTAHSWTAGSIVDVACEALKQWPEPELPDDIRQALAADPRTQILWNDITPMARWDWLRWIRATLNPATRSKRIDVMRSKLNNGDRRPCCFNRTMCTDYSVAKAGVLLAPQPVA